MLLGNFKVNEESGKIENLIAQTSAIAFYYSGF